MKKILTASLVAIMAVTAANAEIASTQYVNKKLTGDAENGTLSFTGAAAQQTTLQGAVNAIADSLSQNLGEGGNVSQQIGSAIQGLTGEVSGTGVVTEISQTNGIVTAKLEKIGDDQVNAISQSKITNLEKDLGDKQDKANMIGLVGENYTIPEGKGNEVYLTSDATAKMIDNKMNVFVDNTFAGTVDDVEDLQEDLGTVTPENMGTQASNVADAIKEVVAEKADKADTLAGYNITNAYTKTETDSAITTKVETLDVTDTAVAGEYVSAVSEADGKISVTRAALTPVAKMNVPEACENGTATCALVYDNATKGLKWESIVK